jgi:NadR type nicotinamide-nucleotide adenylyltransferase
MASPNNILRVSVVGGESTGKSTLVAALARHYDTAYAPEFARDYLSVHGSEYTPEQAPTLAIGQMQREAEYALLADRVLFCDTDAMTTMLWSEFYFGRAVPQIVELAEQHTHDLYVLCADELAWEDDGLRRSAGSAAWFDRRLREVMDASERRYIEVRGDVPARVQQAADAIDRLLRRVNR